MEETQAKNQATKKKKHVSEDAVSQVANVAALARILSTHEANLLVGSPKLTTWHVKSPTTPLSGLEKV